MKRPYRHMPTLTFGDYMLRTIKRTDAADMFDYGKDEEVTKFLSWGPFTDLSEAKHSIKDIFLPRLRQKLPIGYAIVDTKKNKMIGTIDFHTKYQNGAEIGYVLHKDYWNQGIMTTALNLIIMIGFEHLNYEKITIKHLKSNIASQKVIEKTLFKKILSEPMIMKKWSGSIQDDLYIYELTKETYYGSKQS